MTRVQGYRPMVGPRELDEVFGPQLDRFGRPIRVESSAGGGTGVLPPADPAPVAEPEPEPVDECEGGPSDEVLLDWVHEALAEAEPLPGLAMQLAAGRRAWLARRLWVGRRAGRRSV